MNYSDHAQTQWHIHYCYRADSTGDMAREITKQIKFYVITKLECITRWKVALRVETLLV